VHWSEIIGEGNKIKLYGFLRLDMIFDTQQPNNSQSIFFIKSPNPRAGGNVNGDFTMHPRLTRLGIDWSGPRIAKLGNAKLSGKFETDFQNGGTESRQIIRIRHAQERLVERVTVVIPKEARQALADLDAELSAEQVEKIAGGAYDTGICKCRNPFDSPQPGQQKGKCCTLFLACITCPNALFFLDDLPRVIALRAHFLAEREHMRRGAWEVLYQEKIKIIEDEIISAFSDAQVAEAELSAKKITDIPVLAAREVLK
jgi:hypothetical protein